MPSQPKPKKPGRPTLPKGEAKGETLRIRITPGEAKQIEFASKISGQTVSEWIRSAVRDAYKQALVAANREYGSHSNRPKQIRREGRANGFERGIRG